MGVQDTAVRADWNDYGLWQTFIIQKKSGKGPVMPGDSIFLRAHTGKFVEVDGVEVQARWYEEGQWQSLVVERSALRRLTEASQQSVGPSCQKSSKVTTTSFLREHLYSSR